MNNKFNPLVSVRILTYNSSKYIIETLNSIYDQTYQNIELIISDDCSKDNTVELCGEWIKEHGARFVNVVILTSPNNLGVCANSRRSLEATKGEWIKGVGGDDSLYPNAIEEYVRFVTESHCEICAARMNYMDDNNNDLDVKLGGSYDEYWGHIHMSREKQFNLIKRSLFVPGTVLFFSHKVYEMTGGPDSNYGAADEWSFIYKILKQGYRIYPLDRVLFRYRVHSNSLTRLNNGRLSQYSIDSIRLFMKEILIKDALQRGEFLLCWHLFLNYLKMGENRYRLLSIIDTLWYIERIKRIHFNYKEIQQLLL